MTQNSKRLIAGILAIFLVLNLFGLASCGFGKGYIYGIIVAAVTVGCLSIFYGTIIIVAVLISYAIEGKL